MKSLKINKKKSKKQSTKIKSKRRKMKKFKKNGGRYYPIKLDISDIKNGEQKYALKKHFLENKELFGFAAEKEMDNGEQNINENYLFKSNLVTIPFNINNRAFFRNLIDYINSAFVDCNPPVKFKLYHNNEEVINEKVGEFFDRQAQNVKAWGPILKLQFDSS